MCDQASVSPRCAAADLAWHTCYRKSVPGLYRPIGRQARYQVHEKQSSEKLCYKNKALKCFATAAAVDTPSLFPSQLRYR